MLTLTKLINSIVELKDNFHETIFLNDSISDIDKQITNIDSKLSLLREDDSRRQKLQNTKLGLEGEKNVFYQLKNADFGCYVIHDIHLDGKTNRRDDDAQIDFLVVTRGYIYILECKTPAKAIKIDSSGTFRWGSKTIISPINQAEIQKEKLKKIWRLKHPKASRYLSSDFDEKWYKTLVVIANPNAEIDDSEAPQSCKEKIARIDNLIETIKTDLLFYSKKMPTAGSKTMKSIAESFLSSDYTYFSDTAIIRRPKYTPAPSFDSIVETQKAKEAKLRSLLRGMTNDDGSNLLDGREVEKMLLRWPHAIDEAKTIIPRLNKNSLQMIIDAVKDCGL